MPIVAALVLVLADRDQPHAELAAPDPPGHQQLDRQDRHERVVERPVDHVDAPRGQRQQQPGRAAGDVLPVDRHLLHEEQERDGDDDERRPTRAQRHQARPDGDGRGDQARHRDPQPRRHRVELGGQHADRVTTQADERALAERHVPGEARDDVQTACADREHQRDDDHVLVVGVVGDQRVGQHSGGGQRRDDAADPAGRDVPQRRHGLFRRLGRRGRDGSGHAVTES